MPNGNSSYLQIPLMAESDTQKYLLANAMTSALDGALNRLLDVDMSSGNVTLTVSQLTRYGCFRATGHAVPRTLTVPATVASGPSVTTNRFFIVHNDGSDTVTLTHGSGDTVDVAAGELTLAYCDGTDILAVSSASSYGLTVEEESVTVRANPSYIDFQGANVTASDDDPGVIVTIAAPTVQDEGVGEKTDPTFLNFEGAGVTAVADGNGVTITIPGGGSGIAVDQDDVEVVAAGTTLNFTGNLVTAADGGSGTVDIDISFNINPQSTTASTYTVTNADLAGNVIRKLSDATGVDVTVAASLTGTEPVTYVQSGAGPLTFIEDTGVTINSLDGNLTTTGQWSSVVLIPDGADNFILIGNLTT